MGSALFNIARPVMARQGFNPPWMLPSVVGGPMDGELLPTPHRWGDKVVFRSPIMFSPEHVGRLYPPRSIAENTIDGYFSTAQHIYIPALVRLGFQDETILGVYVPEFRSVDDRDLTEAVIDRLLLEAGCRSSTISPI